MQSWIRGLALLAALAVGPLAAAERVERVTGAGLTRDEAVANGLEEAVRRVDGVRIDSDRSLRSEVSELSVSVNGEDHDRLRYSATQSGQTRLRTEGLVSSYEVLKERRHADGLFELDLRVRIRQYETPGHSPQQRRKLAVLPFRSDQLTYRIGAGAVEGDWLSDRLTQHLVNDLTQTRRFSVMDRQYTAEYLDERDFIASPDTPLSEYVRLGQQLGVDYLVVGRVVDAGGRRDHQRLISGERIERGEARLRVDYRVLVMATRQVKWAASIEVTGSLGAAQAGALVEPLAAAAAARIRGEMLDNIYPTRVAALAPDGQLILNQGGNAFRVGQQLQLYRQGALIRDPYSGESLGRSEIGVGRIEIQRVLAKTAYARLLEGAGARVGDLCRSPVEDDAARETAVVLPAQAEVRKAPGGGVLLPFD